MGCFLEGTVSFLLPLTFVVNLHYVVTKQIVLNATASSNLASIVDEKRPLVVPGNTSQLDDLCRV